jgi:hypothetical protein
MRYILATTLLMTVGMASSASAACGPAVQNWQNGSQTTCTYDSNGGGVKQIDVSSTPAPTPVEEDDDCDYGDYGDYGDYYGKEQ